MNERMKLIEEFSIRERKIKIERFKHLNTMAKKGQIVFAGSSLTEQFPINEMLQNCFDQEGKPVIIYNRGIGGDITTNLLQDLDLCVLDLEPSKVFINIGTNDIAKPDYSEATLLENYSQILRRIREALPTVELFILSYYPVNPDASYDLPKEAKEFLFSTRTNAAINHVNEQLQQLASDFHATYIDVSSVLLDEQKQLKSEFTVEGVHLWPNAYQKVLDILLDYLVNPIVSKGN